jgi:hypothetical protein
LKKKIKLLLKNNIIKIVESIQVNPSNYDLYHEIRKKNNRKENEENHKAYFKKKNQYQMMKSKNKINKNKNKKKISTYVNFSNL